MSDDGERPELVPLNRATHLLSCCRQTIYRMHADKQIILRKLRSRTMVPMSEIKRIKNGEPMQATVGEPVGEPIKRRPKKVKLDPHVSS